MQQPSEEKSMSYSYDLEEYIATLDNFASNHDDFSYITISPEMAAVSIAKILQYANKEVKIYDDSLTGDIGESHPIFKKSLTRFLENGKKLKILLRHKKEVETSFFDHIVEISHNFPKQIDLRFANDEFAISLKDIVEKDLNFTVNDENSYRIEVNEHEHNVSKTAFCNFNDVELAEKLNDIFDKLFYKCTEHPMPEFH